MVSSYIVIWNCIDGKNKFHKKKSISDSLETVLFMVDEVKRGVYMLKFKV